MQNTMQLNDIELTVSDIRQIESAIESADEVAHFFAKLGYIEYVQSSSHE